MSSVILNIILFIIRIGTFAISGILLFNLISDAREVSQENRVNGLWGTRIALISIVAAIFIENLIYAIGYVHSGFDSPTLNEWLTNARPIVIVARALVFYGVLKLFILFRKEHKK